MQFRYGLLIDGESNNKIIIKTSADVVAFQKVVALVKETDCYDVEMVKDTLQALGFFAEMQDDSTDEDFEF